MQFSHPLLKLHYLQIYTPLQHLPEHQRPAMTGQRSCRSSGAVDFTGTVASILLVMMVKESMQLRRNHPLHGVVDMVNENGGPYIGLVMAYSGEEIALQDSGFFSPSSNLPFVDLAGRRFNIGSILGVNVISVMTGEKTVNAGITVQILLDAFDVKGVVHYGIAGSTNDSLVIGDVSVPEYVAFTNSWKWKGFKSAKSQYPELNVGAYNYPKDGENLLGYMEFTSEELYSIGKPMEEIFWFPVEPKWLNIATQLKDIKLEQCVNKTYCLPDTPKIVYGLKGATADVFLSNAAYRNFLFKTFNASTADEESAAVVMTCHSNGVPSIVFRGVSDMAGGGVTSTSQTSIAAMNAVSVAIQFIGLLDQIRDI